MNNLTIFVHIFGIILTLLQFSAFVGCWGTTHSLSFEHTDFAFLASFMVFCYHFSSFSLMVRVFQFSHFPIYQLCSLHLNLGHKYKDFYTLWWKLFLKSNRNRARTLQLTLQYPSPPSHMTTGNGSTCPSLWPI